MEDLKLLTKQRAQMIKQQLVLSDRQLCVSFSNKEKIKKNFANTNLLGAYEWNKLFEGARFQFFNYRYMQWLACSLQGSFVLPNNLTREANIMSVHNSIKSLTLVGEASVSGFVSSAKFTDKNEESIILVKIAQEERSDLELYHEYFVGVHLNSLRNSIPNFMFIFGIFRCTKPEFPTKGIQLDRKTSNVFCIQNYQGVNYLLIEKIGNGKSLFSIIEEEMQARRTPLIINLIIQIVCSLYIAYKEFDFCHYDMHLGNVLIRDTPEIYIYYEYEPIKLRVKTKSIATIIDFGRSHIKDMFKNDYGNFIWQNADEDIKENESRPIADLYKFIGSICSLAMDYQDPYWYDLMRFFDVEYKMQSLIDLDDNEMEDFLRDEGEYFQIGDRLQGYEFGIGKENLYLNFLNYLENNYSDDFDEATSFSAKQIPDLNCKSLICDLPENLK